MQIQNIKNTAFVHVQSEASIGRASMTMQEIIHCAEKSNSVKKIILTEYETFSSSMEAYRMMKETGISICVGVEINVHWTLNGEPREGTVLLLPKDYIGQKTIELALSKSFDAEKNGKAEVGFSFLESFFAPGCRGHGHVFAVSGGINGILYRSLSVIPQAKKELMQIQMKRAAINREERLCDGQKNTAFRKQTKVWNKLLSEENKWNRILKREDSIYFKTKMLCNKLESIFGKNNFFIEIVYHKTEMEKDVLPMLVKLSSNLVIADEAYYATNRKEDVRRQHLMESIRTTKQIVHNNPGNYSLRNLEEIVAGLNQILPEDVIERGLQGREFLVEYCFPIYFPTETHYPIFRKEDPAEHLNRLVREGKEKRFPGGKGWDKTYDQRIYEELNTITQTGFTSYFCIVEDIVRYAKNLEKQDGAYYVGPGRGSAVGSLVCYLLGITEVDPIKEGLLFARFLNPSRKTAPDIDTDIAPMAYERVIEYCRNQYGELAVCAISTKLRMGALQALEIAANYHTCSAQLLQAMKGCITKEDITLAKAENLKKFVSGNKKSRQIYADALLLEGRQIGTGQHPSGLVLSDTEDICERAPTTYNSYTGSRQTQFDMVEIEKAGLLKIDLLKLRTLDVISETLQSIGKNIDLEKLPIDKSVFSELFSAGKTVGVFQLESKGIRELLVRFQPKDMEDLTLLLSLYRPGPMQYVDAILELKKSNGFKKRRSAKLNEILKKSYGFPIYQEQLMEIFHQIGGLSPIEADDVRRAIAKKKARFFCVIRQE